MDTEQLKVFCAGLPGARARRYGAPANILTYELDGKRFAYFKTSAPERWRFSFKVTPERFVELTDIPGIKPARWLGRYRWVTVVDVRTLPGAYLTELVQWSYRHVLGTLSRARRRELTGQADDAAGAEGVAPARQRRASGARRRTGFEPDAG